MVILLVPKYALFIVHGDLCQLLPTRSEEHCEVDFVRTYAMALLPSCVYGLANHCQTG